MSSDFEDEVAGPGNRIDENSSDSGNFIEDEVGGPGNSIEGGTAKAVVDYVARSIVESPDAVDVTAMQRGEVVELLIAADSNDMGRLIGKRGRVIQAMRQLARAAGAADGVKTTVDVLELQKCLGTTHRRQIPLDVSRLGE